MKKRFNIIIVLLAFIALMMGILMLITPIRTMDMVKGTIVKAEKYRQNSLSEKDILLRSAISSDTSALKNTLAAILYLRVFLTAESQYLDSVSALFEQPPLKLLPFSLKAAQNLSRYSVSIKNIDRSADTLLISLSGFLKPDSMNASSDPEQLAGEFIKDMRTLLIQDTLLYSFIHQTVTQQKNIKGINSNKPGSEELKIICDQVLIYRIRLATLLDAREMIKSSLSDLIATEPALKDCNKPCLHLFVSAIASGPCVTFRRGIYASEITYHKSSHQFILSTGKKSGQRDSADVCFSASKELGFYCSPASVRLDKKLNPGFFAMLEKLNRITTTALGFSDQSGFTAGSRSFKENSLMVQFSRKDGIAFFAILNGYLGFEALRRIEPQAFLFLGIEAPLYREKLNRVE